jgi:phosphate transport system substrate-binding protein
VSPEWKEKVGAGTSPNWPVGQGGKGNEGVTGSVKQQPNTIGYVELAYAVQNKLPVALVKNASGNFVEPSLDAVTAAAAEASRRRPKTCASPSPTRAARAPTRFRATPTSSPTKTRRTPRRARRSWTSSGGRIHDGEGFAKDLQYAPLPADIVKRAEAKINSITSGGKPLRGSAVSQVWKLQVMKVKNYALSS